MFLAGTMQLLQRVAATPRRRMWARRPRRTKNRTHRSVWRLVPAPRRRHHARRRFALELHCVRKGVGNYLSGRLETNDIARRCDERYQPGGCPLLLRGLKSPVRRSPIGGIYTSICRIPTATVFIGCNFGCYPNLNFVLNRNRCFWRIKITTRIMIRTLPNFLDSGKSFQNPD